MNILFQPDQDEMLVKSRHFYIYIDLTNQTGDCYTVILDLETANFLIRNLLEHVWLSEHDPMLAVKQQEMIPF
ncbi:MAG: hypothetical protein WC340_17885 [Kiritimatiellia bacterium]